MNKNIILMEALNDYVYGHTEAKKVLIALLNRSVIRCYQKYYKNMDEDNLISPLKVLLIAPSGTGKTHLVESLQKILYFPLIRLDATQLIPAGGGSGLKPDTVKKLIIEECRKAVEENPEVYSSVDVAIDRAVVFIDEIDKLGVAWESSGNWNKHVQSNFLTLIENKTDFAGLSFIFAGTFDSITNKQQNKKPIGFTETKVQADKSFVDEKVVKAGLIPELVGRINYIVELDIFTEKDLTNILNDIIIPKKRRDLAVFNINNIKFSKKDLAFIVAEALKSSQGVRYMQRHVDQMFLEREFDCDINDIIREEFF